MPGAEKHLAEPGSGADFSGLLADLTLAVGRLGESMRRNGEKPRVPWEACHPVWFTGQLGAGTNTLLNVNLYGPELPYWWDLRTLNFWGFTAGSVATYVNNVNGQQIANAVTPGEFTWSGQHLLAPQDSMIFVGTGITGVVNIVGQAIEVQSEWLAEYLM